MRDRSARDVRARVDPREEEEEEEEVAAVTIPMACPTSSAPTIPTDGSTLRGRTITTRDRILPPRSTTRWAVLRKAVALPASNRPVGRNATPPTAMTPMRVTTPRASSREGRNSPATTRAAAPREGKTARASPTRTATTVAGRATAAPSEAAPSPPPWGTSSITTPAPATMTRRVTVAATRAATEVPSRVPRRRVPSPSRRRITTNAPCGGTTSAVA
mmetsp:Transcript_24728/g.47359  ORF Transcript_24728/g.47359 Transcript_24728/m.47359 type:complete len:217 (+) Transcript_24728:788-1438(+)